MNQGIYYPEQVKGFARAVSELQQLSTTDDEMVHLDEWRDGTGIVTVQLTEPAKALYVCRNGTVHSTRLSAETAYEKED